MTTPEEIAKVWKDELFTATAQMTSAMMMGNETEKVKVQVEVDLPSPLHRAVCNACLKLGLSSDTIFTSMASHGLQRSLEEKIKGPEEPQLIPGSEGVMEQLSKLKDVTTKMTTLQEMLNNG